MGFKRSGADKPLEVVEGSQTSWREDHSSLASVNRSRLESRAVTSQNIREQDESIDPDAPPPFMDEIPAHQLEII